MGSESGMIPCLDFRRDGLGIQEGGEAWRDMSQKVREACETHGCFLFMCDEVPSVLREEMFREMKALFDLPEETKKKHSCPKPFRSYYGKGTFAPFFENFGIDDASLQAVAQEFTNLMWPQGNPNFCETLKSMSTKMLELNFLIMKMIITGYDLPQHYTSDIENMKGTSDFKLMKYLVPKGSNNDSVITLFAHTDKGALTLLCENDVQGLQVQTKSGEWIDIKIPPEGFVAFVGDVFKAWSNGRLHAATHRVVMSEDKERYSLGLFTTPKDEMEIKGPRELVDDEKMHPLRYKPFNYGEYIHYYRSNNLPPDALEVFAGVM